MKPQHGKLRSMISAATIELLVKAKLNGEMIVRVTKAIGDKAWLEDMVHKLISQGTITPEQLAKCVEICAEATEPRRQRSERQALKPYKPRRDFYGPLVPRLPEKEWWPLVGYIRRRDGYVCAYCDNTDGPWCVDHIVPLSRGGSNGHHNLTMCCIPCNSSKSDRLLSEWKGRYQ